jgi:patatin-like phospholipase/acyl hydrolase
LVIDIDRMVLNIYRNINRKKPPTINTDFVEKESDRNEDHDEDNEDRNENRNKDQNISKKRRKSRYRYQFKNPLPIQISDKIGQGHVQGQGLVQVQVQDLKKIKRILSIDGGGVKLLIPLYFLKYLEEDLIRLTGKNIFETFDMYGGTSAGSIIVGSIVYKEYISIQHLIDTIFTKENFTGIFTKSNSMLSSVLMRPKYSGLPKKNLLASNLLDKKLPDSNGKDVLITAYNISIQRPKFFKSYQNVLDRQDQIQEQIRNKNDYRARSNCIYEDKDLVSEQDQDQDQHQDQLVSKDDKVFDYFDEESNDILISEIIDASSAAPSYFPSVAYTHNDQQYYAVDGAVSENNPTDCIYSDALRLYKKDTDIRILSIGTGDTILRDLGPETVDYGLIQWATKGSILDIILDTSQDNSDYRTKQFSEALGHKYVRVQDYVGITLDDITKYEDLIDLGHKWYKEFGTEALKMLISE